VQLDSAALEFELVDLALAVVLAAGLEREQVRISREVLQQFSYRHELSVARPTRAILEAAGVGVACMMTGGSKTYHKVTIQAGRTEGCRSPLSHLKTKACFAPVEVLAASSALSIHSATQFLQLGG
jgi:hypothetical protein